MTTNFKELSTFLLPNLDLEKKNHQISKEKKTFELIFSPLEELMELQPPLMKPSLWNSLWKKKVMLLGENELMKVTFPKQSQLYEQSLNVCVEAWKKHLNSLGQWFYFSGTEGFSIDSFEALCLALKEYEEDMELGQKIDGYSLFLSHLKLTNQHIDLLTSFLRNSRFLQVLDLAHNPLSLESVHSLGKALKQQTSIRVVKLKGCSLGEKGCRLLQDYVQDNLFLEEVELSKMEDYDIRVNSFA
jgi:hypothetical protein